ncbi:MAG: protein kinase [Anaerolineae bacterium]|nr:protein kinase [Anaerolineae bacterium]
MSKKPSSFQARLARAILALTATQDGSLLSPETTLWLAQVASGARTSRAPREARRALVQQALALYRILGERSGAGSSGWIQTREPGTKGTPIAARVLPQRIKARTEAAATYRQLLSIVRRLNHPSLAPLVEAGEEDGLLYLLVRMVDGAKPLTERLRKGGPWELKDATNVALKAAEALGHAHEQGLFHGSLGSDQVFINDKGQVMVRGVGLSQLLQVLGVAVPRVRTLFTPPEVVAGANPDARSDVYALGALLYLLLARRGPARDAGVLIPASRFNPAVWPALDQVLENALSLYPDQRFATARDFAWALRLASREAQYEIGREPKRVRAAPAAPKAAKPSPVAMPAEAAMPEKAAMPISAEIGREDIFPAPAPMPEIVPMPDMAAMPVITGAILAADIFPTAAPMPQVDTVPLQATALTLRALMMPTLEIPQSPPIPEIDWEGLLALQPIGN